ncbi:MAG: UDP-N-acetylmuramoyl-L-alanyl-D-glutamate--2,6-diaminopimelate ligase, partial [Clostridia bacterium]|nr:UDP-N-acetylmuramoyl-L-alanyl-D-glutamate--2,6-diaminopimelate ligase [Clostridia bacterium]
DRDPLKRKDMAIAVSRYADLAYITSDNSRSEDPSAIIKDILKGMNKEKPFCVIPSRRVAIETAVCEARAGDILLLCGKGHETYEIDREGVHPFYEADAVRAAFQKRMKGSRRKRV